MRGFNFFAIICEDLIPSKREHLRRPRQCMAYASRRGRQLGNGWARLAGTLWTPRPPRDRRQGRPAAPPIVAWKRDGSFSVAASLSAHRAPPCPQNASLAKRGLKEVCARLAGALALIESEVATAAGAGLLAPCAGYKAGRCLYSHWASLATSRYGEHAESDWSDLARLC